jgi:hypothetical protein
MASTTPTETKQPDLWISEFVTFSAATVFIGLRLLSRRLTRIEFWWDDWFAIGCYVCRHTSFIRILANLSGCGYCLGSDYPSLDRRRSRTSHQRHQVQKDQGGDLNAEQSPPICCRVILCDCLVLRQGFHSELLLAHVPSYKHQATYPNPWCICSNLDHHPSEYNPFQ